VSGWFAMPASAPEHRTGNDAAALRDVIDATHGCELFSLRQLRVVTGRSAARSTGEADELLFVRSGRAC